MTSGLSKALAGFSRAAAAVLMVLTMSSATLVLSPAPADAIQCYSPGFITQTGRERAYGNSCPQRRGAAVLKLGNVCNYCYGGKWDTRGNQWACYGACARGYGWNTSRKQCCR